MSQPLTRTQVNRFYSLDNEYVLIRSSKLQFHWLRYNAQVIKTEFSGEIDS